MPERGISFRPAAESTLLGSVWVSPKVTLPPHLIRSQHQRVPRKTPRIVSTTASAQRRNQTLPRSPALTPRFTSLTRSPSIQKRVHPRRRSRTRTRQTNTSMKNPTKSRPLPSVHPCSPSSQSNTCQKWHGLHQETVVFSCSF